MMNGKIGREKAWPRWFQIGIRIYLVIGLLILLDGWNTATGEEKKLLLGFKQTEDSDSIPEGWELITFSRRAENEILLVEEEERTVVHVRSLGSASSLLKRLDVDIKEFPLLVWRWKINRVVGMAIESKKDRNDSAARIRVVFGKGGEKPRPVPPEMEKLFESFGLKRTATEPPGFKIDYIWGNRLPQGESLDYPGSRNHKMIAVQSGKSRINRWIWEKRNLVEDYEMLFGTAPPGLSGIVILTDTDQTNEGVQAWYSSVVLMRE